MKVKVIDCSDNPKNTLSPGLVNFLSKSWTCIILIETNRVTSIFGWGGRKQINRSTDESQQIAAYELLYCLQHHDQ